MTKKRVEEVAKLFFKNDGKPKKSIGIQPMLVIRNGQDCFYVSDKRSFVEFFTLITHEEKGLFKKLNILWKNLLEVAKFF